MTATTANDLIDEWVRIPLADSRSLAAHLWRPVGTGRVPAILDLSPYRAFDIFRPVMEPLLPWWAARGYAVLAIDTAGSGGSTGLLRDEYLAGEIDDAVAAVAWAAAQPWCDGAVGLSGLSWAAFVALRAAARKPPALKAMVLGGVSEDGWTTDIHSLGGASYAARVDWAGVMLMFNALPPDPLQFGDGWREQWLSRLDANRPWIEPWLAHPERDAYWQGKAATPGDTPLLLYSGWADKYATSVLRIAADWRGPVRTIIGPWEHASPATAQRQPRIGFLQEALRWWDRWLKGRETGVLGDPSLRLWVASPDRAGGLADGAWRGMDWPMPEARSRTVRFGGGTRRLRPDPRTPAGLGADLYEDAPNPWLAQGALLGPIAPDDQEIVAAPVLRCRLRSDRAGGLLVARLLDVDPQGKAVRMTTAALNLAFHTGAGRANPPAAGEVVEVVLPFQATAWRLRAGHRLGLLLSSQGWPTFWPAPDGATLVIDLDSLELSLPLAPTAFAPVRPFEVATTAKGADLAPVQWLQGPPGPLPTLGLANAASRAPPPTAYHALATATDYRLASRFELALTDGGRQAVALKAYDIAFERPDWSIRVATRLVVRSTPSAFDIDWTVKAIESGQVVFDRDGTASVPRRAG